MLTCFPLRGWARCLGRPPNSAAALFNFMIRSASNLLSPKPSRWEDPIERDVVVGHSDSNHLSQGAPYFAKVFEPATPVNTTGYSAEPSARLHDP